MMRYLVLTLVLYLIYKYVRYVFHSLSRSTQGTQFGDSNNRSSKIHVEVNPKAGEKKFEDGEYIDFEEVK